MTMKTNIDSIDYSITKIDKAGEKICNTRGGEGISNELLNIINWWRRLHNGPMDDFLFEISNIVESEKEAIVVSRLKTLESTIEKLKRNKHMKLTRIDDLGGCRMIVTNIKNAYYYSEKFKKTVKRHELINVRNYIEEPQKTGYRSLHLIYKYKPDIYNKYPIRIEIQFRTHLQHIWATAVEVMGLMTNQNLKENEGDASILRFFVLASSLFAIEENCPTVPNTPLSIGSIVNELQKINEEKHILDMLFSINLALKYKDNITGIVSNELGYYLLVLNYKARIINILYFKPEESIKANESYEMYEKRVSPDERTVLVKADSMKNIQIAYQNYFLDINEFVDRMRTYLTY